MPCKKKGMIGRNNLKMWIEVRSGVRREYRERLRRKRKMREEVGSDGQEREGEIT